MLRLRADRWPAWSGDPIGTTFRRTRALPSFTWYLGMPGILATGDGLEGCEMRRWRLQRFGLFGEEHVLEMVTEEGAGNPVQHLPRMHFLLFILHRSCLPPHNHLFHIT